MVTPEDEFGSQLNGHDRRSNVVSIMPEDLCSSSVIQLTQSKQIKNAVNALKKFIFNVLNLG